MHTKAKELLATRSGHQLTMNARQFINHHRANMELDEMDMPDTCLDKPPPQPNVYTDGAFKHPQTQRWSLGGFGVWWADRNLETHPLTALERTWTTWKEELGKPSLWGSLSGHRASSTRTELAAGSVSMLSTSPVHQATDSMAYSKKMEKILAGQDMTERRPWGIQTDGDLWELMERIVKHKGGIVCRCNGSKDMLSKKI